jgi:hypothetical protein
MADDGGLNAHKTTERENIPVVDKLLAAGAVLHARPNGTGVPFHSAGPGAQLLGVTRNPRNCYHRGQIGPIYPRAPSDQPSDARIRIPPISIVPDVILLRGCSLRVSRRRRRLLRTTPLRHRAPR